MIGGFGFSSGLFLIFGLTSMDRRKSAASSQRASTKSSRPRFLGIPNRLPAVFQSMFLQMGGPSNESDVVKAPPTPDSLIAHLSSPCPTLFEIGRNLYEPRIKKNPILSDPPLHSRSDPRREMGMPDWIANPRRPVMPHRILRPLRDPARRRNPSMGFEVELANDTKIIAQGLRNPSVTVHHSPS